MSLERWPLPTTTRLQIDNHQRRNSTSRYTGEASISFDAADKLAAYFKLELRPVTRKPATKAAPKRKGN